MLTILILMFVLLIWDKFPAWLVFMGTITVCMTFGLAPDVDLLKGFGNPGVVTVAVLFVVAAGMYTTGAITLLADKFIGLPKSMTNAQVKILGPTAVGSAFLNNTPLVAMMIPVVRDITRVTGLAASKLYLPMSFASILGGASTLIGTSVNLILAAEADVVPDLWMTIGLTPRIQSSSISADDSERYTHRLVEVVIQARAPDRTHSFRVTAAGRRLQYLSCRRLAQWPSAR